MPGKNVVKNFDEDSMYHVYNRGNNKRQIFFDEKDYSVFLSFLKYALLSDEEFHADGEVNSELLSVTDRFELKRLGLAGKLELVSYCLMPNHFHLQLFQYDIDAITRLMRSISTGYVMYFNKRYETSGSLFQGVYKASKITDEAYNQHISRYIHLNALDTGADFRYYDYSSYKYYGGAAKADWVHPEKGMMDMNPQQYEQFIIDWIPQRNEVKDITKYLADK
jgi:putative transposase